MDSNFWLDVCQFAHGLTQQVGQQLMMDFGTIVPQPLITPETPGNSPQSIVVAQEKSDGSLVTRCDRWADQALRGAIAQRFPDHGLLSEETPGAFPATDWCWIIDPIDGTTNFTMGLPVWGISLGLLYRGTPVFGCVHFPPLGQTFHGFWPGTSGLDLAPGAFCNHQPIQVSAAPLSPNHLFSFCTRSVLGLQQEPACHLPLPCKVRMIGVATYNLITLAQGTVLAAVEASPRVWDIAAVWVIVQGAGGQWISLERSPFPLIPGENYHPIPYPTLALARSSLAPQFLPFAQYLGQPVPGSVGIA
jgi:myo-inositol-1(or 4)-monophosphatase